MKNITFKGLLVYLCCSIDAQPYMRIKKTARKFFK